MKKYEGEFGYKPMKAIKYNLNRMTQINIERSNGEAVLIFLWNRSNYLTVYTPLLTDKNVTMEEIVKTAHVLTNIQEELVYIKMGQSDQSISVQDVLTAVRNREFKIEYE